MKISTKNSQKQWKKSRKGRGGRRYVVDLEFVLTFYDAYIREPVIKNVAAAMEITPLTLNKMLVENEDMQLAKQMADMYRTKNVLRDYVLRSLSAEARKIWESLQSRNSMEEIEELFRNRPVRLRQQLFCHALLHTGYDVSKACHMVGIDFNTMKNWKHELGFAQLLEEVQFHKKNFFEHALIGLISEAHPGAVIFANRTVNADRGYSEKLELRTTETPAGTTFDISDLDLDLDTRRRILDAIEKKKQEREQESGEKPNKYAWRRKLKN